MIIVIVISGCAITPYKKSQRISSTEIKENAVIVILPRKHDLVFRDMADDADYNVNSQTLQNNFKLVLKDLFNVNKLYSKSDPGSGKYFDRYSNFDTTYSFKAALTVPSRDITISDKIPDYDFFKSENENVKYAVVIQEIIFEHDSQPKYRDGSWPFQNWIRTYVKFYTYNFEKKKVINFGDNEVESTYYKKSGYKSDSFVRSNKMEFKKALL
jgi:hypothetical protein